MTPVRMRLAILLATLSIVSTAFCGAESAAGQNPLLLRTPSLSQNNIAFRYADDIWTVSRQGGEAERLTSDGKVAAGPFYSPDGSEIA